MELLQQRGAIPIHLDGRQRILFFDNAATWLLVQKFGIHFNRELYAVQKRGETTALTLKSLEALQFFLWTGLQAELESTDETLTLDEAGEFIRPWTIAEIFNATVLALTGATATPAQPGKADAAGATPKPAAKKPARTKASTGRRPSASRSAD